MRYCRVYEIEEMNQTCQIVSMSMSSMENNHLSNLEPSDSASLSRDLEAPTMGIVPCVSEWQLSSKYKVSYRYMYDMKLYNGDET